MDDGCGEKRLKLKRIDGVVKGSAFPDGLLALLHPLFPGSINKCLNG